MTGTPAPPLGEQPSRMPSADLGSAFASEPPKDRSRGLAGRLAPVAPPPPAAPAPDTPADEVPVPVDEPDSPSPAPPPSAPTPIRKPAPKPDRRPASAAKPPEKAPDDDGGRKTAIVYVRWPIRDRLRAHAGMHPELTHTDVVLQALDSTHDRLRELFESSAERVAPSGLFSGRPVRGRRRRQQEPQVQVSIRPWEEDLAVIDRLVDEVKAPNRSALVDAALDLYLPGAPEPEASADDASGQAGAHDVPQDPSG